MGFILFYVLFVTVPAFTLAIAFIGSRLIPFRNIRTILLEFLYLTSQLVSIRLMNRWYFPSLLQLYCLLSTLVEIYTSYQVFKYSVFFSLEIPFFIKRNPVIDIDLVIIERNFWISSFTWFLLIIVYSVQSLVNSIHYNKSVTQLAKTELESIRKEFQDLRDTVKLYFNENRIMKEQFQLLKDETVRVITEMKEIKRMHQVFRDDTKELIKIMDEKVNRYKRIAESIEKGTKNEGDDSEKIDRQRSSPDNHIICTTVTVTGIDNVVSSSSPAYASPGLEMMGLQHPTDGTTTSSTGGIIV